MKRITSAFAAAAITALLTVPVAQAADTSSLSSALSSSSSECTSSASSERTPSVTGVVRSAPVTYATGPSQSARIAFDTFWAPIERITGIRAIWGAPNPSYGSPISSIRW